MTSTKTSLDVPRRGSGFNTSVASTVAGDDFVQEKLHDTTGSDTEKHETSTGVSQNGDAPEQEYPTGMKMFFIVFALVCSIFLLALDMVCCLSNN